MDFYRGLLVAIPVSIVLWLLIWIGIVHLIDWVTP